MAKEYKVKIVGITPYMQHKLNEEDLDKWEKERGRIIEREDVNKEDLIRAEYHMYIDENGKPYLPTEQIRGSFINAGSFVKAKVGNAKKSMKNIVAGMFYIKQEKIKLPDNWIIDKRSAVNRNVKARIITIRPKWEKWEAEFTLIVDNDTITDEIVKKVIEYAGQYCGIGSFRPTNNGMFGRFKINNFQLIK